MGDRKHYLVDSEGKHDRKVPIYPKPNNNRTKIIYQVQYFTTSSKPNLI